MAHKMKIFSLLAFKRKFLDSQFKILPRTTKFVVLILTSGGSMEFFICNEKKRKVLFFYLLVGESDFNSTINRITNSTISMKLRICSMEDPPQDSLLESAYRGHS